MKNFFFLFLFALSYQLCYTQENTYNQWTYHLGYENTKIFDKQNSPLIYSANSATAGVGFGNANQITVWKISLSATFGNNQAKRFGKRIATLEDPYDIYGKNQTWDIEVNPGLSFMNFNLAISYLPIVQIGTHNFQIGARLENSFFQSGVGAGPWLFNTLTLGPELFTTIKLNNGNNMPLGVNIPIISCVSRESFAKLPGIPYKGFFDLNFKKYLSMVSFGKFQKVGFELGYMFSAKDQLNMGLNYSFYWYHYKLPRDLKSYSNKVTLSLQNINR